MKTLLLSMAILLAGCDNNGDKNNPGNHDASHNNTDAGNVDSRAVTDGHVLDAYDNLSGADTLPMDARTDAHVGTLQDAGRDSQNISSDAQNQGAGAGENCGNTTVGTEKYIPCCPPNKDCSFLKRPTCDCVVERGHEGITRCLLFFGATATTTWPSVCE